MKKTTKRKLVKLPDNKADRDKLIENLKKDLEESLKDPAAVDRLVQLVKVLQEAKKGQK